MIDLLIGDLDKEITESKVDEKDAQADYEAFMKDSAEKRALDSRAIADKEGSKAALEEELLANQEALKANQYDLMDTEKYIMEVHAECDWLLEHFDLRKEARAFFFFFFFFFFFWSRNRFGCRYESPKYKAEFESF